mgnify:CR=1 FL=1
MVSLHLLGIIFLQPQVLLEIPCHEANGKRTCCLHRCLSFLAVVDPQFRPPTDAALVRIDGDEPGDVEALDVDVKIRKWVNESALGISLVNYFFFTSGASEDRKML